MNSLPVHSPLGGSGTYRWMACPGSVALSHGVDDPESDFASEGTAAHALGAMCLRPPFPEPWQLIGVSGFDGWPGSLQHFAVDKEMADAVQVYVSAVAREHPDRHQGNTWVERPFHVPSIHPLMYGTADLVHIDGDGLHVWDYKHGVGVVVEVQENPQLMYYACGVLEDMRLWEEVERVVLHVCQPRAWHPSGPVREWSVSTDTLALWLEGELVPAMHRAQSESETASGEHCRFCPVRRMKCPQLWADMEELEELMAKIETEGAAALTADEVARVLDLGEVFKIQYKAAQETAFARAEKGTTIPGWKLVAKKANRVWREGAEAAAVKLFGKKHALTEPALRSPAQIEALARGKAFAAEWAYKPDGGLVLVRETDNRQEQGPSKKSMFKPRKEK